nr:partner and localizer of BRCA2 isoform X1 [Solea senegalensis]
MSRMESNVEEQLKTTLHYDDKEKLRKKLELLQREYLKTAQRLQRAERLDAVRRHVKSRISQQNHQDQSDPEVKPHIKPSSLTLNSASQVPADPDNSRSSQEIRFLFPSDAACQNTPDPSHDADGGHRPSSALRLRSWRSRLRWERKSAEASMLTDNSGDGKGQSEKMEYAKEEGEEDKVKSEREEVVNESEKLFSASETQSSSLLLSHWKTHAHTGIGDMQGSNELGEMEVSADEKKGSELVKFWNAAEESIKGCTLNGKIKEREGDVDQNTADKVGHEKSDNNIIEIKEEKIGNEKDEMSVGLLDSCTLVEGLLFPAEYYVRTTRRMTSSQSQPDIQAVILSQLSAGRHRRSRGRGRGVNRHTHSSECSDQHIQTEISPLTIAPVHTPSQVSTVDALAELTGNSPNFSEISNEIPHSATPRRGGKRKRGRGRGRTPTPRSSLIHQAAYVKTSEDLQPTTIPVSSSQSLHAPGKPKPRHPLGEPVPVADDSQPASTAAVNETQSSPASGELQKLFPIFLKSSSRTNTTAQIIQSTPSCRSLLLPSSPSAHTSLLPLSWLTSGSLLRNMRNLDIHQDFHLPDDQFASLKLHKLRKVAMELEHFTPPSYNTRSSNRYAHLCPSPSDPVMSLPLPLSLTPMIANSQKQAATQSGDEQNLSVGYCKLANPSLAKEPSNQENTETHREEKTENTSTESVIVVHDFAAGCLHQTSEQDTEILNVSTSNTQTPSDRNDKPQLHVSFVDMCVDNVNDYEVTLCAGDVSSLEDQSTSYHQGEDRAVIKTLYFDCTHQEMPGEPFNSCTAAQTCNDSEASGESPAKHPYVKTPDKGLNETIEAATHPPRDSAEENQCLPHQSVHSQLLLSPTLASAPYPFTTTYLPPSALISSPTLPSVGLTPHRVSTGLPLTSSPSAPALTLPPPHSPASLTPSPPTLSPCQSITSLPPSQSLICSHNQASLEPPDTGNQCQVVEPTSCPTESCIQSQGSSGQAGQKTEETAEQHVMRCMDTLKAPAGGCLVDTCCLLGPSGELCVAAAGKWAVCVWSQTPASDWTLIHTWTFNDPVINVSPIPDAAGLMIVTLGQLEIREVRLLSCSSLMQVLLCEGVVQAAVGVSKSRVVTSSHSTTGSTLQVFSISDHDSTPSSQPLVSPGVCIGALAPVEGLSDAVLGTDEGGRVFVWNLETGQLLRKIVFGDGLSHTVCLRGFSSRGVLFVLLQHQSLSSLDEQEKEAKGKDGIFSEEEEETKKTALFSLLAVNPLNSKSVVATRLYPPKAWSGRLCEADVSSSRVVGLSQSGCVCVWELGRQQASRMVWAPEGEGWQVARWGGRDTLVTGHLNGDVTLHCYRKL